MSFNPYPNEAPLTRADLEAVATALGLGPRASVRELTREQKAAQEAKLAPYFRSTSWSAPESRRSEGARRGRLKVLARKAAEREAQS